MDDDDTAAAGANWFARWVADDSFRPHPPDLAVYRYKGMYWFAPFMALIPIAIGLVVLLGFPGADVAGHVIVPLVAFGVGTLTWLGAVTTAVRVRADCLVIDNWLVRHVIPWERFAGLYVEPLMGMFARVDDGTVVKSASFSRSLSDAAQGYAHQRDTLERVREDCRRARAAHAGAGHDLVDQGLPCRRSAHVPWRPLLALLVAFEAFSWIAFAARGG